MLAGFCLVCSTAYGQFTVEVLPPVPTFSVVIQQPVVISSDHYVLLWSNDSPRKVHQICWLHTKYCRCLHQKANIGTRTYWQLFGLLVFLLVFLDASNKMDCRILLARCDLDRHNPQALHLLEPFDIADILLRLAIVGNEERIV